jgi:glycosyltransferase involved in cell wall biosynthesis
MRVAVFLDRYTSIHDNKDPGQLVVGFRDLGHHAEIVTVSENAPASSESTVTVRRIKPQETNDASFWAATPYDLVICYTWLRKQYLPMLIALRLAGKRTVVKCDSDGRYTYPVYPRWGQAIVPTVSVAAFKILLRKLIRRAFSTSYLRGLVAQVEASNGLIIESPGAYSNLTTILAHAGRGDLSKNLYPIPNPVEKTLLTRDVGAKDKIVLAVGDWTRLVGESYQKNTNCMAAAVSMFLAAEQEYQVIVTGRVAGTEFAGLDLSLRKRLSVRGEVPHSEVIELMNRAQVLLIPSMVEGFSIAASEAVCMGCSIVGTPLESLIYLAKGGFGGTLSHDFGPNAVLGALLADVNRWNREEYDANVISRFWRERLAPAAVCKKILSALLPPA